jgi:hypothetical protein
MAPKTQTAAATAVEPTKTVAGYAIQLTGFIPIPKDDLRAQAKLTATMADVDEQVVPFSAIFDLIQDRDFRVQPINRRYTEAQAAAMLKASYGSEDDGGAAAAEAPKKTPEFDADSDAE